jgi:hypothetical protein
MITINDILAGNANNNSEKSSWNYTAIHKNNICNCAELIPDEKEFLALKANSQLKKKIRVKLRKVIDNLNETFLTNNTDKTLKLKTAQSIKIFIDTFNGKDRVSDKVFEYLKTLPTDKK